MRDAPQPKSIEVLAAEVRDQLAAQRSYVETLEAKAGAVLGFAGLLIVLAPGRGGIWIEMSRLAGVVSAAVALFAYLPRDYGFVDLRAFRAAYVTTDPALLVLALVDTYLGVLAETVIVIDHKSRRLKGSIAGLAVAIIFAFVDLAG